MKENLKVSKKSALAKKGAKRTGKRIRNFVWQNVC